MYNGNDPINTLAQWVIWRIEIKVLGALGATAFVLAWFVVYALFGPAVAAWVFPIGFGILAIVIVYGICVLIYGLLGGDVGSGVVDKVLANQAREDAKWARLREQWAAEAAAEARK